MHSPSTSSLSGGVTETVPSPRGATCKVTTAELRLPEANASAARRKAVANAPTSAAATTKGRTDTCPLPSLPSSHGCSWTPLCQSLQTFTAYPVLVAHAPPSRPLTRRELVVRAAALSAALALPALRFEPEAGARELGDPRIRALARILRGPVITPASSRDTAHARLEFDGLYDGVHPLAIAQPLDAADVSEVVRLGAHDRRAHRRPLRRAQLRRLLDDYRRRRRSLEARSRARRGRTGRRRPGRTAREHLQHARASTGSRFPPAPARASESAAMHSVAVSAWPHAPGALPPTTSTPCRSSPPTAGS